MRKSIIAANWKMHGDTAMATELLNQLVQRIGDDEAAQLVIFPPSVYLALAQRLLQSSRIQWGGQNLSEHASGAYTGEISAAMLTDLGCRYVLVGHSERRQSFGDSDQRVAEKFHAAKAAKLIPILCIGETEQAFEDKTTQTVLARQLDAVMAHNNTGVAAFEGAVIAYEPIWAIGTGKTASPEQAQQVHSQIREKLQQLDSRVAEQTAILYGGSVKPQNAAALFDMPDIDGGLIGGASLQANDFIEIATCIK